MAESYDILISGGGPAGTSAAWQAATSGLKVLVCDRATFPRDKPCGDGITPRAIRLLTSMGMGAELERFHRVEHVKVVADAGTLELRWPDRPDLPRHAYVAPRTEFDAMLMEAAERAGAEVRVGTEVVGPLVRDGAVYGLRVRASGGAEEEIHAPITIAADGMSSRVCRTLGMGPRPDDTFAVAVRAQVESKRPDDKTLECFVNLHHGTDLLPGYGWVFPMGDGRLNIGVGYMSSYPRWRDVNINMLMADFVSSLPADWEIAPVSDMVEQGALNGWRLPMGLSVWPPWRPGMMAAGDAIGAAKPFTGVGISKAMQTGVLAAETAVNTLAWGDPEDLSNYEGGLHALWGSYYRIGRAFVGLLGKPRANHIIVSSGVRARLMTDLLFTLFTGNGDSTVDDTSFKGRLAMGMTRLARVGSIRSIDATDRVAVAHPPSIRSRARKG